MRRPAQLENYGWFARELHWRDYACDGALPAPLPAVAMTLANFMAKLRFAASSCLIDRATKRLFHSFLPRLLSAGSQQVTHPFEPHDAVCALRQLAPCLVQHQAGVFKPSANVT